MTNRELGNAIRKKIKALGYTSKDVSVRVSDAGYETAVHIYIKNMAVNEQAVKGVAKSFEYIDRDERSYEILSGGNTFVFVEYDYDTKKEAINKYLEAAQEIMQKYKELTINNIAQRGDKVLKFYHGDNADSFVYIDNLHRLYTRDTYGLAFALAKFNACDCI